LNQTRPDRERQRRRQRLWLLAMALLVAGTIAFATGQWVNIYGFFAQMHQELRLVIVICIVVPVLAATFVRSWSVEEVHHEMRSTVRLGRGKLAPLCERIEDGKRSPYSQAVLVDNLAHIASEVVALREGAPATEIRRQCYAGEWIKDAEMRSVICRELPGRLEGRDFQSWYEKRLEAIESYHRGGIA